jgi:hypothetical protein
MSATTAPAEPQISADNPAAAFTSVLNAAVGSAATKLNERVSGWTDKLDGLASGGSSGALGRAADEGLDDLAEGGGATQTAAARGTQAGLHGKSPFWAAVKGAWEGGKPVVKAAIVAAFVSTVLLLLLSPVLLLVFLLSWLIIAAVHKARAGSKS